MLLVNIISLAVSPVIKKKLPIKGKERVTGQAKMFTKYYRFVKKYVEET